ncbi:hypothetical protein DQ244_01665 [Blastococcus sp. TBT05-19]|uniref:hypothetical protein n=1 Tax=Blastococcus sp. TBT05-19 TaxID=2250581 RepID=UPI000DEA73EF|nr:hypothetical protein [Blastococcus sp. TBT05-19]RBY94095.1 hypothetical protein DQ244_01665 [Blastococcus sp. TBT05-19]
MSSWRPWQLRIAPWWIGFLVLSAVVAAGLGQWLLFTTTGLLALGAAMSLRTERRALRRRQGGD